MNRRVPNHNIRWYVYVGEGRRIPHVSTMRGTWGYDAVCSCGWDSHTGGATRSYVESEVMNHKRDVRGNRAADL